MLSDLKSLKLFVLTNIVLGLVMVGCGGSPGSPEPINSAPTAAHAPAPPNPAPPTSTAGATTASAASDARTVPPVVRTGSWTVTAISDDRLGAIARPSSRWPFTLEGDRITLGPLSGTLAALAGGPPTWASAYSVTIDGSTLTLHATTFWGAGTIT